MFVAFNSLFVFLSAAQVNSCQCGLFSLLLYFTSVCSFGYKSLPILFHLPFLSRLLPLAGFSLSLAEGVPAVPAAENPEAATVPTPSGSWLAEEGLNQCSCSPALINSCVSSPGAAPPAAAALLIPLGFANNIKLVANESVKTLGLCSHGRTGPFSPKGGASVIFVLSLPYLSSTVHLHGADYC